MGKNYDALDKRMSEIRKELSSDMKGINDKLDNANEIITSIRGDNNSFMPSMVHWIALAPIIAIMLLFISISIAGKYGLGPLVPWTQANIVTMVKK